MRDRDENLFRIWRCGREAGMPLAEIEQDLIAEDEAHSALRALDSALDMELEIIARALNRRV